MSLGIFDICASVRLVEVGVRFPMLYVWGEGDTAHTFRLKYCSRLCLIFRQDVDEPLCQGLCMRGLSGIDS